MGLADPTHVGSERRYVNSNPKSAPCRPRIASQTLTRPTTAGRRRRSPAAPSPAAPPIAGLLLLSLVHFLLSPRAVSSHFQVVKKLSFFFILCLILLWMFFFCGKIAGLRVWDSSNAGIFWEDFGGFFLLRIWRQAALTYDLRCCIFFRGMCTCLIYLLHIWVVC